MKPSFYKLIILLVLIIVYLSYCYRQTDIWPQIAALNNEKEKLVRSINSLKDEINIMSKERQLLEGHTKESKDYLRILIRSELGYLAKDETVYILKSKK